MTVRILIGDVRDRLREMPADSFDCVVTSPPYWGLRDYGVAGQIGLEPTLGEHLAVMVDVFDEVRRVLKPTGTLWLNYGDCYATTPNGRSAAQYKADGSDDRTFRDKPFSTIGGTLKPKDLCMIPNRLAIALQDAGWWVRSEIIWAKPNPMPESIRDRPTSSHEKIWLMSKSARYHYAADAVKEPAVHGERFHGEYAPPGGIEERNGRDSKIKVPGGWDTGKGAHGAYHREGRGKASYTPRNEDAKASGDIVTDRNLRNVWTISSAAFSEAHFATFPPALAERCLKAGCPAGGYVLDPFGGAGTTALVADRLGLHCTLIELNPEYAAIARRRIEDDAGMFSTLEAAE